MAVIESGGQTYHIDDKLMPKWDSIRNGGLAKIDEDRVYIVDGREGSGKSVFTLQQAGYIDPTLSENMERVCFTADEVLEQIRKCRSTKEHTVCIIFDEAFRGLSSRSALSKTNKQIIQSLMEMREKNLVLFIVSPSFFLIDLYAAMIRSNALFHIAKKKGTKLRSFKMYSHKKKAKLYQHGIKRGWEYKVYTHFMGRFPNLYPGGKDFEKKYRELKRLAGIRDNAGTKMEIESKLHEDLNKIILNLYEKHKSSRKTEKALKELGVSRHFTTIAQVVAEKNGISS